MDSMVTMLFENKKQYKRYAFNLNMLYLFLKADVIR